MCDEVHSAVSGEVTLGVVPVAAEFVAVAFLVLLRYSDEFLEVWTLLVFLIVSCIDVVIMGEAHEVIDFVFDDANVAGSDCIDFVTTVLQKSVLAGFDDLGQ